MNRNDDPILSGGWHRSTVHGNGDYMEYLDYQGEINRDPREYGLPREIPIATEDMMGIDASQYATSGNYLKKEDVPDPREVTVFGCKEDDIEGKKKLLVKFEEYDKPLVLNVGNTQVLVQSFGANTDSWKGKKVTIFTDPNVTFGGSKVGGLRLKTDDADIPF